MGKVIFKLASRPLQMIQDAKDHNEEVGGFTLGPKNNFEMIMNAIQLIYGHVWLTNHKKRKKLLNSKIAHSRPATSPTSRVAVEESKRRPISLQATASYS